MPMTHKFIYHFHQRIHTSMSAVNDCLTDILWLESSKLKLNAGKTDLIIVGTKQQQNKIVDYFPFQVISSDVAVRHLVT